MTSLKKSALVIMLASFAAPAFAGGIPFNFSTLTFPKDTPETTRACNDLTSTEQCLENEG